MRYITGHKVADQGGDATILVLSTTDTGGKFLPSFKNFVLQVAHSF